MRPEKLALTAAAGLIGQNLIPRLKNAGYKNIVAIDKHPANTAILRRLHPDMTIIEADLATSDSWQAALAGVSSVVISHTQIGGFNQDEFISNNVTATQRLLDLRDGERLPARRATEDVPSITVEE